MTRWSSRYVDGFGTDEESVTPPEGRYLVEFFALEHDVPLQDDFT